MAELLAWADCYHKPMLHRIQAGEQHSCGETLRKKVTSAVLHVHAAIAWFCRPTALNGAAYQSQLGAMKQHLWDYAEVVEEAFGGPAILKLNLH